MACALLSGGGLKTGQVIGGTDKLAVAAILLGALLLIVGIRLALEWLSPSRQE